MNVTIYPGRPSGVNFDAASVVKNIAGATVQYCDTEDPFVSEGSIAVGASQTLSGTYFFTTPATALLSYTPLGPTTDAQIATLGERIGAEEEARADADGALDERTDSLESGSRLWFPVPTGGDDSPELLSRLAAGEKDIPLRRLTYNWNQLLGTIPAGAHISGEGKGLTIINKNVNGNLATLAADVTLERLKIIGNGATRTGAAFALTGTDGGQTMRDVVVVDFDGYILDFAVAAGSLSLFENCQFWQTDGTAAGEEAVHISDTQQLAATPRKFIACESGGKRFIHLGGCNNVFIVGGGYIGEIVFTAESRAVIANGVRFGGLYTAESGILHVKGFNHSLVGDFGMNVVIDAGYSAIHIDGTYNGTVTDSSGFPHLNSVTHMLKTYVPALTTGASAPALGDGAIAGNWSRSGSTIHFAAELTAGTTTSLGTGDFRISIPVTPLAINQTVLGMFVDASTGINYVLIGVIASGTNYVSFRGDALAGAIGQGNLPGAVAIATGDIFRVGGAYQL